MLRVGDLAPEFDLPTDGGGRLTSAALAGKPYVLYFYPRDATPGCTTEACDFRDSFERLRAAGATVAGVSKDSVASHDRFRAKHDLPFPLLSDPERTLHVAYGAWGKKKMYGKEVEGVIRSTFLVGADGRVAAEWRGVRVAGHVAKVTAAVEAL